MLFNLQKNGSKESENNVGFGSYGAAADDNYVTQFRN